MPNLSSRVRKGVSRHEQHLYARAQLLCPISQLQPAGARHYNIGHDHVDVAAGILEYGEGGFDRVGLQDLEPLAL